MAWWLFQNIVVTAALAGLVAMVCRFTRIGPVARHALWVIVLVKFVTPPLVVWPWAVPDPLGLATLDVRVDDRSITHVSGSHIVAEHDRTPGAPIAPESNPLEPVPATRSSDRNTRVSVESLFWLLGVWAAGSLCFIAIEGIRIARLARRVSAATPGEPAVVNRVAVISSRLGLRPMPVVTLKGMTSPMVWCLGRPRLLWPADLGAVLPQSRSADSTAACIEGVIVHELAHVKRRDHVVGWIELVAGVVWWWNPLFWYVRSALREQAELACDAWVISAFPDGRRAYAESLLALSGAMLRGTPSRSMAAVIGISSGSRRVLERRLVMIMKGGAPLRLPLAGLLALALIAGATLPGWASGVQQQPPPPPAAPKAVKPAPQAKPDKPAPQSKPDLPPPPPAPSAKPKPVPFWPMEIEWARSPKSLASLPPDGRQLVETFDADRLAIRQEMEKRIVERREALVKALQDLQDQYTKAGKLDEAVAIRDYLRTPASHRDWEALAIDGRAWRVRR